MAQMLGCMRVCARSLLRSRLLYALVAGIALMAALPLFQPMYAGSTIGELRDKDHQFVADARSLLDAGAYDTAPQDLRELVVGECEALEEALSAQDDRRYFEGVASFLELRMKDYELGYLVGPTRWSLAAEIDFYASLAKLDAPAVYGDTSRMPGLNYACFVFANNPSVLWLLLPVAFASALLFMADRRRLLGNAPIPQAALCFSVWAVVTFLSIGALALSFAPGMVGTSLQNGLGDASYPVVFTQNEEVVCLSIAWVLGRQALLYALAAAFVSAAAVFVWSCADNPFVALGVSLVMCLVPEMSGYMGAAVQTPESAALLSSMPMTYFDFSGVAGYPTRIFAAQLMSIDGISYERGVVVLVTSTLLLAVLVALALLARRELGKRRRLSSC